MSRDGSGFPGAVLVHCVDLAMRTPMARRKPAPARGSGAEAEACAGGYGGSLAPHHFRKLPHDFRSHFRKRYPGHLTTLRPFALELELKISDRSIWFDIQLASTLRATFFLSPCPTR